MRYSETRIMHGQPESALILRFSTVQQFQMHFGRGFQICMEYPESLSAVAMHGDFASVGASALSIEVPWICGCPDPHPLCVHEVFFKAQSVD
jgi:hypothetical protein